MAAGTVQCVPAGRAIGHLRSLRLAGGEALSAAEVIDWRRIALDALSDLCALGVPVEEMLCMTPAVHDALEAHMREQESYS